MVVQQGRRRVEPGGGTDRTSWGRSPVQWILANGKTPPALPPSENLNQNVEDFDEPRTKLAGFFSILLDGITHIDHFPLETHSSSSPALPRTPFHLYPKM